MNRMRILALVLLVWLVGCTTRVPLVVTKPAKIDTTGIRKIAVGPLELVGVRIKDLSEADGNWSEKTFVPPKQLREELAKQVRARVINRMAETPYFSLVYADEYERLETSADLRKMIAAAGYSTKRVDAIISGRYWLDVERRSGAEPDKVDLLYSTGGQNNVTLSMTPLAWWPYIETRASMSMEINLTRTNPAEVVASRMLTRSYGYKVSDKPGSKGERRRVNARAKLPQGVSGSQTQDSEVLPSIEELAADLADSIALSFTQEVSVTERTVYYPIAKGGDEQATQLIKGGAYDMAITRLEQVTAQDPEPADLYNLALCFEAVGEYGLARNTYIEAWEKDRRNSQFAAGLGRIEALVRENPRLKNQMIEKGGVK